LNATTATPTFRADVPGVYTVALTVSDGSLTSAADQLTITVATGNLPPLANAGPDQTVTTGQVVTLNGTGSSDPNGDPLTYSWCLRGRPQGSTATLNGANTARPTFTPDVAGSYVLCLTVNDGQAGSASDSVVIDAQASKFNGVLPTTRGPKLTAPINDCCDAVAVSADGNTVLVGAPGGPDPGGAYVFVRSDGSWTQQGPKLVGTGAVFETGRFTNVVQQGHAVALSADGNTALVGGFGDNMGSGAAWVFTRNNGVWTQQGPKLLGDGANTAMGASVALSADGNTSAIGAYQDNGSVGAVWIFTRNAGVWTRQAKLIATDSVGPALVGFSVALDNTGTTLVAGGPDDNKSPDATSAMGAVWIFTRNGDLWTQQGRKLVGAGATGPGFISQGVSVAVSADGNTVLSGGRSDNGSRGATWVFIREAGVWRQQGPKLVANDAIFTSITYVLQGHSVALSADGNVALVGGPGDNMGSGAAWFFTRTGGIWTQRAKIVNPDPQLGPPQLGSALALDADATTAVIVDAGDVNGAWIYGP
jgi:hypothetical protein